MTGQTWRDEFYPKPASSEDALANPIAHSLVKWTGALPENLLKHNVWLQSSWAHIVDESKNIVMSFNTYTCALCRKYQDDDANIPCEKCPLYALQGNVTCDGSPNTPYGIFTLTGDVAPMISALEALEDERKRALYV